MMANRSGDYAVLDQGPGANGSGAHGTQVLGDLYGDRGIDSTPRWVGGFILGSVATLIALRALGFRFSFGVGVGGGS